jgi:hypothetical protein
MRRAGRRSLAATAGKMMIRQSRRPSLDAGGRLVASRCRRGDRFAGGRQSAGHDGLPAEIKDGVRSLGDAGSSPWRCALPIRDAITLGQRGNSAHAGCTSAGIVRNAAGREPGGEAGDLLSRAPHFTLVELQEAVAGSIETVPLAGMPTSIASLIVNKDGHRLGLAMNDAASFLAGQPIVGSALKCPRVLPR